MAKISMKTKTVSRQQISPLFRRRRMHVIQSTLTSFHCDNFPVFYWFSWQELLLQISSYPNSSQCCTDTAQYISRKFLPTAHLTSSSQCCTYTAQYISWKFLPTAHLTSSSQCCTYTAQYISRKFLSTAHLTSSSQMLNIHSSIH